MPRNDDIWKRIVPRNNAKKLQCQLWKIFKNPDMYEYISGNYAYAYPDESGKLDNTGPNL